MKGRTVVLLMVSTSSFSHQYDKFTIKGTKFQRNINKFVSPLLALVWRSAPVAPLYLKEKKAPRDFIGLNKGAVQSGLTTAQEHFQYRATHDMRRKDSGNEKTSLRVKRIPPTMVFGIPTK